MSIEVKGITKTFGHFKALDDVSLKVGEGELVALLGPSGSGKTTLLRIIAGLEFADGGEVLFSGKDARDKKTKDRGVGFVFQHYALFRHMTVFENVAFGMRVKPRHLRLSDGEIRKKVHELLKLVQLEVVGDRFPSQLSGGQRQRIALARALAVEPKVLLLDEPFGSLDARVRKELRQWLRHFHEDLHITSLFVTHDQEEALEVADQIVVMNQGKVEQMGTPGEVYHHPANSFVLNFLGNVNLFHCRIEDGKAYLGDTPIELERTSGDAKAAKVYFRPHELQVTRQPKGKTPLKATIRYVNPAGAVVKLDLAGASGEAIQVEMGQEEYLAFKFQKGEDVYVSPKKPAFSEYSI